jgi:hypothetical protein
MNNFLKKGGVRMNLFKSLKNKKGMSGAVKASLVFLTLAFLAVSVSYIVPVFAVHETTATITPTWLLPNTFYAFTINVSNAAGSGDYISEIRFYNTTSDQFDPDLPIYNNFICNPDNDTSSISNLWPLDYSQAYGVVYCHFYDNLRYPNGTMGPGHYKIFYVNATTNDNETCIKWIIEPRDTQYQWNLTFAAYTCVDKTPPTTTKTYGTPTYVNDGYRWITNATSITLAAVDGGPTYPPTGQVGVGVDKIQWRVTLIPDKYDEGCTETCTSIADIFGHSPGEEGWSDSSGPSVQFNIAEDSCHLIEFYANDSLGNTETVHRQCVFVDNQPPVSQKSFIGKTYTDPSGTTWITQDTLVNLSCQDQQPHPSDNVTVYYRYNVDGGAWHKWYSFTPGSNTLFNYVEDSNHTLEWYCVDALGNEETHHLESDKVDSTPPVITKTTIGPSVGGCPGTTGSGDCYIKDTTGGDGTIIHVEATDPDPTGQGCNVNQVKCEYYYTLDSGTEKMGFVDDTYPPFDIKFNDDSTHYLKIKCWDKLGNIVWDNETFFVDSTPPTTTKTYGDPHYPTDINTGGAYPHYINSSTLITLTATDAKVGVDKTFWRDTVLNNTEACYDEAYCKPQITKVLIVHANMEEFVSDVYAKLSAYPDLNVSLFDASINTNQTPTLAYLEQFDSVLVYSNYIFANSTALGDVLADYADNGGGVVLAMFDWYNGAWPWYLQGRYMTDQYGAIPMGATGNPYTSGSYG